MAVRPRFDPAGDYAAARAFTYLGRPYPVGAAFPHPDDAAQIPTRMVSQQYGARAISLMTAVKVPAPEPIVKVEQQAGGFYLVTAPWLAEAIRVRGKAKASAKEEELLAQEPLAYGGVEVEGAGDAWTVKSAWGETAETLESETAARARAQAIRKAGPPEGWTAPQT